MAKADYEGVMAVVYDAGRGLSAETVSVWMQAAARYIATGGAPIVDLGAGTGRFSAALAETFAVPVLAVEPARAMREQARRATAAARVLVVGGKAEQLPVRSESVGGVWASQMLHHIDDLAAGAHELRRVLRPGAPVLVRGSLRTTADALPLFATYFPTALRLAAEHLPMLDEISATFTRAGLQLVAHEMVVQTTAGSRLELWERTQLRADTALAMMPDDEFAAGLARLHADALAEVEPTPVRDDIDLVVFG